MQVSSFPLGHSCYLSKVKNDNIDQPSIYIAVMNLEETFEHVHFEWTAERSVQLRIREVTLTFST
jgi:hypothetical protein